MKGWLSDDQKWYWLDKKTGMMFAGGWKQIDGKWYYFYTDGTMAVNTTIDGYTIGSDGARKVSLPRSICGARISSNEAPQTRKQFVVFFRHSPSPHTILFYDLPILCEMIAE